MELSEAAARTESAKMKSPVHAMTHAALARAEQAIGHAARATELALQAGDRAARLAIPGEPSYWSGYCLLVRAEIESAAGRTEEARRVAQSPAQGSDRSARIAVP